MKFSVKSNDLVNAVSKVISVLQVRSSLPILANLYLKVTENKLEIMGTDLEVYLKIVVEVNGQKDGEITIPGKKFHEILQNLSNREITIEAGSNLRLTIKSKEGKWNISGEDANEFPSPTEMNDYIEFKINSEELNDYLTKAIHAASTDELRRSMNGVYFEIQPEKLVVVSTDGHRLVKIIRSDFTFDKEKKTMLIPIKTCNLLSRLYRSSNNEIVFRLSDDFLKAECENISITSRLIDDTFPNYESVIPLDNEKKLTVKKDGLIEALKRSIVMSDQLTYRTTLLVNENELKIKSSNNEFGTDSEEGLDCKFNSQENFEISYNGRYLLDALTHFDSDEINFEFNSPLKASILKPVENKNNEDMMMLVMPVRNN